MDTQEKANELLYKLIAKEKKEGELKEINKEISFLTTKLNDAMTDEEINSIVVQNIKFEPIEKNNFSLTDTEEGMKWVESKRFEEFLKVNKADAIIKTVKQIHHATLQKTLEELIANGVELPNYIKHSIFNTINWNKAAIKRMVENA